MPISPSDLPWWGWILCAIGAGIVALITGIFASVKFEGNEIDGAGCLSVLVAIVSGLGALGMGVMGIILFVKWVWTS